MENEHCMLLALPCGRDHMDVLQQSKNLIKGFITYLQQKQAAGIINVAAPGTTSPGESYNSNKFRHYSFGHFSQNYPFGLGANNLLIELT